MEFDFFHFTDHGFYTNDSVLKLDNGGYKITRRPNGAKRIQGMWLTITDIENQMVYILCSSYENIIILLLFLNKG